MAIRPSSMVDARRQYHGAVVSCSALKRAYRDRLRAIVGQHLRFVMLDVAKDVLLQRMDERDGHHMPSALLDSQLSTPEHPRTESDMMVIDGEATLEQIVAEISIWRHQMLAREETW